MDGTRLETDVRTRIGAKREDDRDAIDAIFRNAEEEIMVPEGIISECAGEDCRVEDNSGHHRLLSASCPCLLALCSLLDTGYWT